MFVEQACKTLGETGVNRCSDMQDFKKKEATVLVNFSL